MIKTLAFAMLGLPTALALSASAASAQSVTCHVLRTARSSLEGTCVQGDTLIGQVTFGPARGNPPFWSGTIRGAHFRTAASTGPAGASELQLDTRSGGALGFGRAWLSVSRAAPNGLRFSFNVDEPAPPSYTDAEILHRARTFFAEASHWFKGDSTDMAAAPLRGFPCFPAARQSMFCAVYLASVQVAGYYAHFRPAVNAVRSAIAARSKKPYRHPLVDFNNDSATSLADVHAVLDAALAKVWAPSISMSQAARPPIPTASCWRTSSARRLQRNHHFVSCAGSSSALPQWTAGPMTSRS
jgi:hypothetical protein